MAIIQSRCPLLKGECCKSVRNFDNTEVTKWVEQLQFCGDDEKINVDGVLNSLTGRNLLFPSAIRDVLKTRYDAMRRNYRRLIKDCNDWRDGKHNLMIDCLKQFPDALLRIPLQQIGKSVIWNAIRSNSLYHNIGHDLPIWLYLNNPNKKLKRKRRRVMIVSQDPLRDDHEDNALYLSTPFGLHFLNYLVNVRNGTVEMNHSLVIDIIWKYLENMDIVYLTDINKIYVSNAINNGKRVVIHDVETNKIMKECITSEIKQFQPDIIMAWGKEAAKALSGNNELNKDNLPQILETNCKARVFTRYHPSYNKFMRRKLKEHYNYPQCWFICQI